MTGPELGRWEPMAPAEVASLFAGAEMPWWIAGGWAIDLALGRRTRDHDDIDVGIFREDAWQLRTLFSTWDLHVASGGRLRPWVPGEALGHPDNDLWAREEPAGPWRLQLMLNDGGADTWVFRRDPSLRIPLRQAVLLTAAGVPYLAPRLQLLFKARGHRAKDDADLAAVLPRLSNDERAWLASRLAADDPQHPWLQPLSSG